MDKRGKIIVAMATLAFVAMIVTLVTTTDYDAVRAANAEYNRDQEQARINSIVWRIEYIEDSRVGLCYAHYTYYIGGGKGESITNVQCDKIPPNVLQKMK